TLIFGGKYPLDGIGVYSGTDTDKNQEVAPPDKATAFRDAKVLRGISPHVFTRGRHASKVGNRSDKQHEYSDQQGYTLHRICIGDRAHTTEPAKGDHNPDEKDYTCLVRYSSACKACNPLSDCDELFQKEIRQRIKHQQRSENGNAFGFELHIQPVDRRNDIMFFTKFIHTRCKTQVD